MLLGERIGAQEAAEFGLVSSVVPPERLDETVAGLAAKLAAKSPLIPEARPPGVPRAGRPRALPGAADAARSARGDHLHQRCEGRAPFVPGKAPPSLDVNLIVMNMRELVKELEARREEIRKMGRRGARRAAACSRQEDCARSHERVLRRRRVTSKWACTAPRWALGQRIRQDPRRTP